MSWTSAAIERLEQQIGDEVNKRFPGAVQRVTVLQYGDEPMIEPGELLVRFIVEAAEGHKAQEQALHAFEETHGAGDQAVPAAICPPSSPRRGGWRSAPAATPATAPG